MSLEAALDVSWERFVAEWCVGVEPAFTREQADMAFDALLTHLPERVDELRRTAFRGISIVSGHLHIGLLLAACAHLKGFERVVARARKGESAALSELKFVRRLERAGFRPELEPDLDMKVVDALITPPDGINVYFEVVAPNLAEMMSDVYAAMKGLADQLVAQNPGACIEVLLQSPALLDAGAEILETLPTAVISQEVLTLRPGVLVRKQSLAAGHQPIGLEPAPGWNGPVLVSAAGSVQPTGNTSATISLCVTDPRAGRILDTERRHFQRGSRNVLVIDVSRVPDGIRTFGPALERQFTPKKNRRFSAVLLFSEHRTAQGQRVSACVSVVNPYAHVPVPGDVLNTILHADA